MTRDADPPPTSLDTDATLTDWCKHILLTPDPDLKIDLTFELGKRWRDGTIKSIGTTEPPSAPAPLTNMQYVRPGQGRKIGKGLTLASRCALLHALAGVETNAIDTALDNVLQFHTTPRGPMPRLFFDDMVRMANEEAKHFRLLTSRLRDLGSHFGAFPVHDGIWTSCAETANCPTGLCRLTLVHLLHEARGLDVNIGTIDKFKQPLVDSNPTKKTQVVKVEAGMDDGIVPGRVDHQSVEMLKIIYEDEVGHVEMGRRWFEFIWRQGGRPFEGFVEQVNDVHDAETEHALQQTFKQTVRKHYKGNLKGPFNIEARDSAGLTTDWYGDLVDED